MTLDPSMNKSQEVPDVFNQFCQQPLNTQGLLEGDSCLFGKNFLRKADGACTGVQSPEVRFHFLLQLISRPCMYLLRLYAGNAQVRGSGNEDEAYRISLAGGVRDLAVVEALLASSAASGGTVPVASIP